MKKLTILFFVLNCLVLVYCASILDYLTLDAESRDDDKPTTKNCICNGPSCICCIDFNMTYIDLGGPGCVRLNYLSPEEGVAINVSYGENLLHSETVKGPDPLPTCLDIFSKLAQMCARFSELLPTDDGMRGCLQLEPMLLGDVQIEIPVGCFRMGANGMTVIESSVDVIKEQEPVKEQTEDKDKKPEKPTEEENEDESSESDDEGPTSIAGLNADDIIAAVNKSADEGIALISNWLGLNKNKSNSTETAETTDNKIEETSEKTES